MRSRRLKVEGEAVYHCMSRTVNGAALLDVRGKAVFRRAMLRAARFSGVEILTYCLMSNHFHILVRIPPPGPVSDEELVRRYRALYPKPTRHQAATAADMERLLRAGGADAEAVRARLLARMGDVSQFMKTLKQRFSTWYNKTHERFGPFWAERFKSVLVEGMGFPILTVAAYIDLNPVRAGLNMDPKDYRFCGYAEAVAGERTFTDGLRFVVSGGSGADRSGDLAAYRRLLFGKGSADAQGAARIPDRLAKRVLEAEGGRLSPAALLRCRIRHLTEGAAFGSAEFVRAHAESWQRARRRKFPARARRLEIAGRDPLMALNSFRGAGFT